MRKSWDQYFMDIANMTATRSTCDRKHVGCVLVKDKRIISTGYNGSIPGAKHCDEVGHDMVDGHCVRNIHAEINAIVQAALTGVSTKDTIAYINTYPCWSCFKQLIAAGINSVVYGDDYGIDDRVMNAAKECGIKISKLQ